jgi:hypothetical protein
MGNTCTSRREREEERNRNYFIRSYVENLCNIGSMPTHFQLNTYEDLCIFITKNPKIKYGRLEVSSNDNSYFTFHHFKEHVLEHKLEVHIKRDIVDIDIINRIIDQLIKKKNEITERLDTNNEERKKMVEKELEKVKSDLNSKDGEISKIQREVNKEKNNSLDQYDPTKLITLNVNLDTLKKEYDEIKKRYDSIKSTYDNYEKNNKQDEITVKNIELFIHIIDNKTNL